MRPSLETVCARIQRAAVDPDAWRDVQFVTEAFMGARGAHLASVDVRLKHMSWNRTTRYEEHDAYIAEISGDSEPVRSTLRNPNWRRLTDFDIVTPDAMKHSFYYTECAKIGIGYRLGLRLLDTPDRPRHGPHRRLTAPATQERDDQDRHAASVGIDAPARGPAARMSRFIPNGI